MSCNFMIGQGKIQDLTLKNKQNRIESDFVDKDINNWLERMFKIDKGLNDKDVIDKESQEFKDFVKSYKHCFPRRETKAIELPKEILDQQANGLVFGNEDFKDEDVILDETDKEKIQELKNNSIFMFFIELGRAFIKKRDPELQRDYYNNYVEKYIVKCILNVTSKNVQ